MSVLVALGLVQLALVLSLLGSPGTFAPGRIAGSLRALAARRRGGSRREADGPGSAAEVAPAGSGQTGVTPPAGAAPSTRAPLATAAAGQTTGDAPAPSRRLEDLGDPEFLPAALEILVTPPSPVAVWLAMLICAVFAGGLAWAYIGRLDIHAVAPGRIQPSGRSKLVQPLEPGKVAAIHVENGSRVDAGSVLVELDPTDATADQEAVTREHEAASAEADRRKAAVVSARRPGVVRGPIEFRGDVPLALRAREESVLDADLTQLRAQLASLTAQLAERSTAKDRLNDSIEARQKLIALSRERVGMRQEIETRGAGSRAQVIEALQQLETHLTSDVGDRGQLREVDAAIVSLQRKAEEAVTQFVAEQTQRGAEADRKRDRLEQELAKARSKRDRTQLRSPIAGTVQQLSVTTIGQVVTSGQPLLIVVPLDGPIEVEAMIANKDIGFVRAGQPAIVKVEAFPFTRYGTIDAEVARVSREAVEDPSQGGEGGGRSGGAAAVTRVQNLVFPATLRLGRRVIDVDGTEVLLGPGMQVTVEIKTGQRRVIDYVLSPLREVAARTGRER